MNSKAVITLFASSNAIKIDSKADLENFWDDTIKGFDIIGRWTHDNVLVNIPNTGTAVWDYLAKADGLQADALYLNDNLGNDLLSGGEYVFTSGDVFTDSWEWATDKQGQNWVALGRNWVDVSVELVSLDLEGAWRAFFDKDNYQHKEEDETLTLLSRQSGGADATNQPINQEEEEEDSIIDRYNAYVERASDVDRIERELEEARALKAEICDNYTPKVGNKFPWHYAPTAPSLSLPITKTDRLHYNRYEELRPFYAQLGGSPNWDECAAADCLHPCYGASHEMNCSLCHNATFQPEQRQQMTDTEYKLICRGCSVPPKEFEIGPVMTFEEWLEAVGPLEL